MIFVHLLNSQFRDRIVFGSFEKAHLQESVVQDWNLKKRSTLASLKKSQPRAKTQD